MPISRKTPLTCPIERALHCVGARYKAMIVYRLLGGPRRYSELRRSIPDISERMLSTQLRQLIDDGVISREAQPPAGTGAGAARSRRLGAAYRLTEAGERLKPVFDAMFAWGSSHDPSPRPAPGAGPARAKAVSHAGR